LLTHAIQINGAVQKQVRYSSAAYITSELAGSLLSSNITKTAVMHRYLILYVKAKDGRAHDSIGEQSVLALMLSLVHVHVQPLAAVQ